MRHQVAPAVHPDALYASWHGQPFRAKTSTSDGTVLLIAPAGTTPPGGFDHQHDGAPAKVVADAEAPDKFTIRTHCRYADELFVLADQLDSGALLLRWLGTDEAVAAQLGLLAEDGGFGTTAAPEHIEALWQERHDFTERTGAVEPAADDPKPLLRAIGRALKDLRPEDGSDIAARFRQVGDYAELEVRGLAGDVAYSLSSPPILSQLFGQLRAAMYKPGEGTWFQGTFRLTPENNFDFDYDTSSQPRWRRAPDEGGRPTAGAFAVDLARYPRKPDQIPPWLAARAGLPLDITFRHALVLDNHTPGEQPVVRRPPVPAHEVRGVLSYLYRSPVVHVGGGPQRDLFAPQTAPSVPHAFHTDGTWIWPAAVPHYLRMHGVAPEAELLDHIRANSYRPPFVKQRVRDTARADVLGEPYPPQSPEDLDEHDAVTEVEREDSMSPQLRASELLTLLHKRVAELGISREAYRIGETANGAWCLLREPAGWQVAFYAGDVPQRVEHFTSMQGAAAHLLGALAFHPTRGLSEADEAEDPSDWPILPLRGEPPLSLFRGKRLVVLPAGSELVRFGDDSGNLTHAAGAKFRETSLLPDREAHRVDYRVTRPLRVLTGVCLPWGGMPGGALAYLLPRAVAHHVVSGALEQC